MTSTGTPKAWSSQLRNFGSALAHLCFLGVGITLVALDAWDDLKYQLAKAMR